MVMECCQLTGWIGQAQVKHLEPLQGACHVWSMWFNGRTVSEDMKINFISEVIKRT
jgi:hypothetical protein